MTDLAIIKEIKNIIKKEKEYYYPFTISQIDFQNQKSVMGLSADGNLVLGYKNKKYNFTVKAKAATSLRYIQETIAVMKSRKAKKKENLMLLIPYINKNITEILIDSKINAIDLNGNYFIQTDDLTAIRLDRKNRYKQSAPIKKIFSQNSSIVSRLFLNQKKGYSQVNEVYDEINKLGGGINLPTVSKVIKRLDEELIIKKDRSGIELLQPEKLLEMLNSEYSSPKIISEVKLNLPIDIRDFEKGFIKLTGCRDWVRTGVSSAEYYAATSLSDVVSVYIDDLNKVEAVLQKYENERFFNCIIYETTSNFVYFNRNKFWSSRVQAFLELSQLDKREKELAREIKKGILKIYNV